MVDKKTNATFTDESLKLIQQSRQVLAELQTNQNRLEELIRELEAEHRD